MRNQIVLLLPSIFIFTSCTTDLYYKNKSNLVDAVNKIESSKRTKLISVDITDHKISGNNITVYITGKHLADATFADTLTFEITGDGYLINK
jgi:hypothetical protein